jgi:hypothetical protein
MKEKEPNEIEISAAPNLNYESSVNSEDQPNNYYGCQGAFGEPEANQVDVEGNIANTIVSLMLICIYVIPLGAKIEYQSLKRELSKMSRRTDLSKAEEGQADSEEFNLDEFLHGISRQQEENGSKRKHLGVSWRNMHVEVRNHSTIQTTIDE